VMDPCATTSRSTLPSALMSFRPTSVDCAML
jgi:hypothetical protein